MRIQESRKSRILMFQEKLSVCCSCIINVLNHFNGWFYEKYLFCLLRIMNIICIFIHSPRRLLITHLVSIVWDEEFYIIETLIVLNEYSRLINFTINKDNYRSFYSSQKRNLSLLNLIIIRTLSVSVTFTLLAYLIL